MKKNICFFLFKTFLPAACLVSAVLFVMHPVSCRATVEGLSFLEGDFTVPSIKSLEICSSTNAVLEFSKEVESVEAELISRENSSVFFTDALICENNKVNVSFNTETEIGAPYLLEGKVKDKNGNSLTFSVSFSGFNSNAASLIISEIRDAYGITTSAGVKTHKSEFVELVAVKGGNLSGIQVISACDGEAKKYVMPNVEVKKGDYITVHLRSPVKSDSCPTDSDGIISETSTDLNLSFHVDSSPSRDLWSENNKAVIGESDIVAVENSWNGKIQDAVLFAKSSQTEWNGKCSEFIEKMKGLNLWTDSNGEENYGIENAFCSDLLTSSACGRSIARQNVNEILALFQDDNLENQNVTAVNSPSVWIVTSVVTPGEENSSKVYVK